MLDTSKPREQILRESSSPTTTTLLQNVSDCGTEDVISVSVSLAGSLLSRRDLIVPDQAGNIVGSDSGWNVVNARPLMNRRAVLKTRLCSVLS